MYVDICVNCITTNRIGLAVRLWQSYDPEKRFGTRETKSGWNSAPEVGHDSRVPPLVAEVSWDPYLVL